MTGKSFCVVCCLQFSPQTENCGKKAGNVFPISEKVCSSLDIKKVSGRRSNNSKVKSEFLVKWVCSECLEGLRQVVERRKELNGVEEKLRDLQLQILRMQREVIKLLRELEGNVVGLKKEVNKMEGSIGERGKLEELVGEENRGFEEALQCRDEIMKVFRNITDIENQVFKKGHSSSRRKNRESEPLLSTGSEKFSKPEECDDVENDDNDIDDQWAPENPMISDEDDEQDYEPSSTKSAKISNSENPSSRPKRLRKKLALKQDEMVSSGDEQEDDDDSIEDDEFQPEESTPKRYEYKNVNALLATLNLKQMSYYKRNIITRTLRRCEKENQQREAGIEEEPTLFDDVNPLKTYSLTYDTKTDTLNLADFQLTIKEDNNSVECSTCGFQCKDKGRKNMKSCNVDRVIYNHVLGFHLSLFQCPHCPASLKEIVSFQNHVLGHRNAFVCQICERPMKSKPSMEVHQWTHMNEQEKQEAIQSGKKPPPKPVKSNEPLQCSICGKKCSNIYKLKIHEKTHQEKDQICPTCGKTFRDLKYHQNFVCYPGKEEGVSKDVILPFACNVCPKKCANLNSLKLHKAQKHSDLRPFQCDLCDKSFKTKQQRKVHQRVHSDERPYVCRGGCGAKYKKNENLRKHEKRCEILLKCYSNF